MARFSVVVPTRDRPDLLEFCLASLAEQTFADFEVVVSDNPLRTPVRDTSSTAGRGQAGVTYRPERPLAMHDNFELRLRPRPPASTLLCSSTRRCSTRPRSSSRPARLSTIRTWTSSTGGTTATTRSTRPATCGRGRFLASARVVEPERFDPADELAKRFANEIRRGVDPVHYYRGKIVFGAYSQELLERIRAQAGRVFHPLAPDYTSMVPACVLAPGALDLGQAAARLVQLERAPTAGCRASTRGTRGASSRRSTPQSWTLCRFLASTPRTTTSSPTTWCPRPRAALPASTPPLDIVNLVRRAREDLAEVVWPDRGRARGPVRDRSRQLEARHGVTPRVRATAAAATPRRASAFVGRLAARRAHDYRLPGRTRLAQPDRHYAERGP